MRLKLDVNIKVNRIIKHMVVSDLLFTGSWSFIQPIFAIFVVKDIAGATIITAGMVAGLYWLVKSFIQLPVANFLDRDESERDDFYALVGAISLAAISAFSFVLVDKIWELLMVQVMYALAMGVYIPAWNGLFSHHLDSKRYSFDWSLDSTAIGFTAFITSLSGGILAELIGFRFVFFLVGIFSLAGAMVLYLAPTIFFPGLKGTSKGSMEVPPAEHPAEGPATH